MDERGASVACLFHLCPRICFIPILPPPPPRWVSSVNCGCEGQGRERLLSDRPVPSLVPRVPPEPRSCPLHSFRRRGPRPTGVRCPPSGAASHGAAWRGAGRTFLFQAQATSRASPTSPTARSLRRDQACTGTTRPFFFFSLRDFGISFRIHIFYVTPTLTSASGWGYA